MDPDCEDPPLPPTPHVTIHVQLSHHDTGCRSLPPAFANSPPHVLPSYPSSTLHNYYPPSQNVSNYAHISSFPPVHPHPYVMGNPSNIPLLSASQSHSFITTNSLCFS